MDSRLIRLCAAMASTVALGTSCAGGSSQQAGVEQLPAGGVDESSENVSGSVLTEPYDWQAPWAFEIMTAESDLVVPGTRLRVSVSDSTSVRCLEDPAIPRGREVIEVGNQVTVEPVGPDVDTSDPLGIGAVVIDVECEGQ